MEFLSSISESIRPAKVTDGEKYKQQLKQVSQDFEAILVAQMLRGVRDSVPKGGLFEDSNEKKIYEDMLNDQLAQQGSRGEGFGFANAIYESLSRQIDPVTPNQTPNEVRDE